MKKVIAKYKPPSEAQAVKRKLDGVTDSCSCPNNEVRLNEVVKILEDEGYGGHEVLNWFIEVVKDPTVNKPEIAVEIEKRIKPAPGPVY